MDWSYVAGLFDGEGSVNLSKVGSHFRLQISISASYEPSRLALQTFLTEKGIVSYVRRSKNPLGHSDAVVIGSWDCARKFCHVVFPYVIEKKRHIAIVFEIFQLRTKVAMNNEMFLSHMTEFDALRHELHALANKGSSLKAWK